MRVPRWFYLAAAVAGTVIPWFFFIGFIGAHGVNIPLFIQDLFANNASGGFSADLLISLMVFWVWSYADAKREGVGHWWVLLPAGFLVGLSLVMPLYFYMREGADT